MLSWPQLQGRIVGDGYRLVRYLDGTETSGRFEAKLDEPESRNAPAGRAMVQLFALTPRQAKERLELWRTFQLLNRPELLKILASGTADWPDLHFDYLVTELPDESLAGVLQDRPLDEEEARQVLESVAAALVLMHDRQCVHASVQPANIYAVGDAIKLSVATVQHPGASDILAEPSDYQAPEVSSFAFSPASDSWSLGVTLFQTLTRELPGDDALERAATMHAPFSEVLKHTLEPIAAKRWTARQILDSLSAPAPERPPILEAAPPAGGVDLARPKGRPVSPYAIAALVLFVAFLWLIFGHRRTPRPATFPAAPVPAVQPAVPAANGPGLRLAPGPSATSTTHVPILSKENVPARPAPAPALASGPVNWRVIAFTYNRESDAAHKAAAVNKAHPGLHAEVFSPQPGRFLVSLGGWMPMNEAKHLRQEAISAGLPPDTYFQNFHR